MASNNLQYGVTYPVQVMFPFPHHEFITIQASSWTDPKLVQAPHTGDWFLVNGQQAYIATPTGLSRGTLLGLNHGYFYDVPLPNGGHTATAFVASPTATA